MLRFVLFVCLLVGSVSGSIFSQPEEKKEVPQVKVTDRCLQLYREMDLEGKVNYAAFRQAVTGYYRIGGRKREVLTLIDFSKPEVLTLIDFSKPSTQERLYVFDMKQRKMLFSSVVSHGKNSGNNYATSFSNEDGSLKSSLGFYLTESTYQGKNGYSLILEGLEKGINDHARRRAIVMHGAFASYHRCH